MISKSNFYPFIFFIIIYVLYSLVRILQEEKVELEGKFDEMSNATRAANAAANDANNTAEHAIEKAGNAQETAEAANKKADDTASKLEDLENKMNDANAIEAQREAQLETQREQQREQQRELLDSNLSVTANNAISELDRLETEDQRLMNANKNYEEEKKAKMLHHANEMNKLEECHKREIAIIEANKDVIKRSLDMIDARWKQFVKHPLVDKNVPRSVTQSLRVETWLSNH